MNKLPNWAWWTVVVCICVAGCGGVGFVIGFSLSAGAQSASIQAAIDGHQAKPQIAPLFGGVGKDTMALGVQESAEWRALIQQLTKGKRAVITTTIELEDRP